MRLRAPSQWHLRAVVARVQLPRLPVAPNKLALAWVVFLIHAPGLRVRQIQMAAALECLVWPLQGPARRRFLVQQLVHGRIQMVLRRRSPGLVHLLAVQWICLARVHLIQV